MSRMNAGRAGPRGGFAVRGRFLAAAAGLALSMAVLSGQEPAQSPSAVPADLPPAQGAAAPQSGVTPQGDRESTSPNLSVEITSPLGRTGMSGPVRIVARIAAKAELSPVQFYVDGALWFLAVENVAHVPLALSSRYEEPKVSPTPGVWTVEPTLVCA